VSPVDDQAARRGDDHDHALCAAAREQAAVSLLSRRPPAHDVRSHLERCPPCHDEYLALAALTPLLETARPLRPGPDADPGRRAQAPAEAEGSPLLLERLMAHVRRRRRRRRTALALVAVGVAAAAVPVARLVVTDEPALGPSNARVVAVGEATAGGARAQVWVRAWGDGSAVTVAVTGGPDGHHCRIVVHDKRGAATEAGVWTMHAPRSGYTEEVEAVPGDIRRVELVDAGTGRAIVDVPVRPA